MAAILISFIQFRFLAVSSGPPPACSKYICLRLTYQRSTVQYLTQSIFTEGKKPRLLKYFFCSSRDVMEARLHCSFYLELYSMVKKDTHIVSRQIIVNVPKVAVRLVELGDNILRSSVHQLENIVIGDVTCICVQKPVRCKATNLQKC